MSAGQAAADERAHAFLDGVALEPPKDGCADGADGYDGPRPQGQIDQARTGEGSDERTRRASEHHDEREGAPADGRQSGHEAQGVSGKTGQEIQYKQAADLALARRSCQKVSSARPQEAAATKLAERPGQGE